MLSVISFRWLLCLFVMLLPAVLLAEPRIQTIDDFDLGLNPNWEQVDFKGQTKYSIVSLDGGQVLQGQSHAGASALVFKKEYDLREFPILSWRWKVKDILAKGDSQIKTGDDYPARIYVVFPHWFAPMTRSINYIWANKLPKGANTPSLYSKNSVMVAVQSGLENSGRWMSENRNVRDDYLKLFGGEPPTVGAIAIMTDSDDTGDSSLAWYDDIRIEKEALQ